MKLDEVLERYAIFFGGVDVRFRDLLLESTNQKTWQFNNQWLPYRQVLFSTELRYLAHTCRTTT
jgi:hypothetical protein